MIGCEGKHLVGQTASTAQEQMLTELAGCLVFMLSPAFGKKKKKKKKKNKPQKKKSKKNKQYSCVVFVL